MVSTLLICLSFVFYWFSALARDAKNFAHSFVYLLLAALFFAFGLTSINAEAQNWGLSYVCSTETHDIFDLQTDTDEYDWTLVSQATDTEIVTNRSGRYSMPTGGVFVWFGMQQVGQASIGDKPCDEGDLPYTAPMNECLGFYASVEFYSVDGNVYTAGSDGWVSFLVPTDAVWTWQVEINGTVMYYQQTETERCHYVG